ncbi:MAG: DNA-binding response regulator [Thiothrix sp.]|nr:MAG: DNA-binding response regulator [Thiothrix sp.]
MEDPQKEAGSLILLIEDDQELAPMIVAFLGDEGYEMEWIDNGAMAVERIRSDPSPDLVILDVMLPGLNGVEVCQQIRDQYFKPVLMLTAKDDEMTEITSLNRGADGYLKKPVRPHVLLAHIKSLLRRAESASGSQESAESGVLQVQSLEVRPASLTAYIDGEMMMLTTAEYQLLEYLVRHAGRMVAREELYQSLRGIDYDGLDRSIDMRVSVLRNAKPPFRYIKTVRGKGYLLALE